MRRTHDGRIPLPSFGAGAMHRLHDRCGKVGHSTTSLDDLMHSARRKDQPLRETVLSSQFSQPPLRRRKAELQGPLSFSPSTRQVTLLPISYAQIEKYLGVIRIEL